MFRSPPYGGKSGATTEFKLLQFTQILAKGLYSTRPQTISNIYPDIVLVNYSVPRRHVK